MINDMILHYLKNALIIQDFFMVFLRVSTIIHFLPGTGESYVPTRYKLCFSLSIAIAASSSITELTNPLIVGSTGMLFNIFSQIFTGILIGISTRIGIYSLQICGTIIAQSSSIAQIFGGSVSNDAQSTISNILTISGITILLINGIHIDFLHVLIYSYTALPMQFTQDRSEIIDYILSVTVRGLSLGFQLSLPFLAISLFYNIILGVINRAMPQLLVSFVGAPAIIMVSIGLLIVTVYPILEFWKETLIQSTYYLVQ